MKRRFAFGGSGQMVPITRDGEAQRLEFAAASRLADRQGGSVELIVELGDGTYRNLGEFDLDDYDSADDLWDYLDDYMGIDDGDDGGYWGGGAVGVSAVSR